MSILTCFSTKKTIKEAVQDLKSQMNGARPELFVYFAASRYNPAALSAEVAQAFAGCQTMGCTTAGEIVSGQMLVDSIVGMAFENEMDDFTIEVIEDACSAGQIKAALKNMEAHFGQPMMALDPAKYIGVVLIDGLAKAEESFMDELGNDTSIFFIGGSAGDDLQFKETFVFANGRAYSHAAVLAVLQPKHGFDVLKTQSFETMPIELEATRVNEAERTVIEFNHRPAVQAYADALGIQPDAAGDQFMLHPFGLMIDGEPYVRSPQHTEGETMVFYCSIREGMKLSLLTSMDIIHDTQKAIAEKEAALGSIRGILNFNCILRTLELRATNQTDAYGKLFADIPTTGFSTYGEEYIGHINQTATMIVFK